MNVIELVNKLIEGVNLAYTRGAYTMAETHELYNAIESIKAIANNQQPKDSESESEQNKKKGDEY